MKARSVKSAPSVHDLTLPEKRIAKMGERSSMMGGTSTINHVPLRATGVIGKLPIVRQAWFARSRELPNT